MMDTSPQEEEQDVQDKVEERLFEGPIPGLKYQKDFITEEEERKLVEEIYAREEAWAYDRDLKRVQVYGYNYLNPDMNRSQERPFPDFLKPFVERMQQALAGEEPAVAPNLVIDQAIIGEYLPGQGIADHVDRVLWGGTVAGLSLISPSKMDLRKLHSPDYKPLWLEPRSLYVLSGEVRYEWTHGIAAVKEEEYEGKTIPRGKRVSITFRHLNYPPTHDKSPGPKVKRVLPKITARKSVN